MISMISSFTIRCSRWLGNTAATRRYLFTFEILHQSKKSNARVGRIQTDHGPIDTPGFVPVGTMGALKGMDQAQADAADVQLMFANTYHLLLQPGMDIIQEAGGLHRFMKRTKPLITDSGGFQVFSLAHGSIHDELKRNKSLNASSQNASKPQVLQISEAGVVFRSYRDGRVLELTPESSVEAQKTLGADIIIPLDELPPYHISKSDLMASLERTHRWERRSLDEHLKDTRGQAMYGVIHGGMHFDLRAASVEVLTKLPFDGFAIGGSVGRNLEELVKLLEFVMPKIPPQVPTHLLGIADDLSIEQCVPRGIDTFDSCYPTRAGRHGTFFSHSRQERVHIQRGKWAHCHDQVIDSECTCPACSQGYSLAYLHHLFKAKEPSGMILGTMHNVHYMTTMMKNIRQRILNGDL